MIYTSIQFMPKYITKIWKLTMLFLRKNKWKASRLILEFGCVDTIHAFVYEGSLFDFRSRSVSHCMVVMYRKWWLSQSNTRVFYLHKIYIHTWMYKRIYKLCWDLTVVFVLLWLWFISERRYSVQNLCVRGNAIDVQTWSDKNKCNGSIVFHSLKYNSSKTNLEHSCWLGHLFLFDLIYLLEVW